MNAPTTYVLGSRQTPTGMQNCVGMRMPAGSIVGSTVHLANGTYVVPDATGTIIVPIQFAASLQSAGWSIVAASNSPAVTVP